MAKRRWYAMVPNIADDEMGPYEYRLYAHVIRWASWDGDWCDQGSRRLSEDTGMSITRVNAARKFLIEKGWIESEQGYGGRLKLRPRPGVWTVNEEHFSRDKDPDDDEE